MYSHVLGRAFNYGQSMIPGKSRKSNNKNIKKAILAKRKGKK